MRLKDKVAIITGGGTGIGKAIATVFASEGAKVVVAARTLSTLEQVENDIKSRGGLAMAVQTDVSDEEQVQHMVSNTIKEYGQVDILVNNHAAPGGGAQPMVNLDLDKWNRTLAVNLTGSLLCAREVLKTMIPRKTGSIINVSSLAGLYGAPERGAYCVSKWGIIGFTEALAIEVGEYNIRVNCISPGATKTDRFENSLKHKMEVQGVSYEKITSEFLPHYSLNRVADPSEIATSALFLASDDSSAITGHNLVVTCGFHPMFP
jgi:NAD(P)-dependent dehydrogenase (short-subunit alcohol dehydrogenase family)